LTLALSAKLNADLILYGLPPVLESEREHLADDFCDDSRELFSNLRAQHFSAGEPCWFHFCIGEDPLGKFCLDRLSESGVDVSGVKILPGKTTGITVILPLAKQRQILTYLGTT